MLKTLAKLAGAVGGAIKRAVGLGEDQPHEPNQPRTRSRRDTHRQADAVFVKRKLGKGFFTRQMRTRTRAALVAELDNAEQRCAVAHGWIGPEETRRGVIR